MGEVGAAPVVSVLGEMPMTGTPLMRHSQLCCNCEECIRKCKNSILKSQPATDFSRNSPLLAPGWRGRAHS